MIDNSKDNSVSFLYVLSTLLVAAFYLFPQMRILIRFDQIAYLTALYYICFVAKIIKLSKVASIMLHAIPFCLLMYVAKGSNFKYGFLHSFMGLWNLIIPSIICIGAIQRNRPRELFLVTWGAIIMLTITCMSTITAMGDSANVMRELTAGTTDENYANALRAQGVGGFGIAYAMGAFTVGLFALFKLMKKWNIWKCMILLYLLFSFYFVTQAQFTTLLIITIVGAAACYFLEAKLWKDRIKVVALTTLLCLLMPHIVQVIINLYEDTTVAARLSRMYDSLWGAGDVSNLSGERSEFQLNAFYLFLESPLWGNNITQQPNAFIHLACHSTLLAVACSTGVIGVWSYLKVFGSAFKNEILLIIDSKYRTSYYPVAIYYLLFAFFNPIDAVTEASWLIFVIIPSLFKLYLPNKID